MVRTLRRPDHDGGVRSFDYRRSFDARARPQFLGAEHGSGRGPVTVEVNPALGDGHGQTFLLRQRLLRWTGNGRDALDPQPHELHARLAQRGALAVDLLVTTLELVDERIHVGGAQEAALHADLELVDLLPKAHRQVARDLDLLVEALPATSLEGDEGYIERVAVHVVGRALEAGRSVLTERLGEGAVTICP